MKLRTVIIRKFLLGAFLIAVCAGMTFIIKESLDTRDPETALPIITITYNDAVFPQQNIYRAGYTWSFITTVEKWQAPSLLPEDLPIVPENVLADMPVEITFSQTPQTLQIYRATGRYSTDFLEISTEADGEFYTPTTQGEYLYKVVAGWGSRGEIQYYFAMSVS